MIYQKHTQPVEVRCRGHTDASRQGDDSKMLKLQMVPSGGCDHRWELCCSDWAVCDIPATHPLRKDGHRRLQVRHNDVVMRQTFDCASSLRLKPDVVSYQSWKTARISEAADVSSWLPGINIKRPLHASQ